MHADVGEMTGNLHVGLAALGAAIGVGFIGMKASEAVGTQSRRGHEDPGPVHPGHRLRRSDRVLRPVPGEVGQHSGAAPAAAPA